MSRVNCVTDESRLVPIRPCSIDDAQLSKLRNYLTFDPLEDVDGFPFCCISKRAVAYSCGALTHREHPLKHIHSTDELEMCHLLSTEVASLMGGIQADWGSEGTPTGGTDTFLPFFHAAIESNISEQTISITRIRNYFGGTLNPHCEITIESLSHSSEWWQRLLRSYRNCDSEHQSFIVGRWNAMLDWFARPSLFKDRAFVRVVDHSGQSGTVFPLFAVGLTNSGSLVGIVGCGVRT